METATGEAIDEDDSQLNQRGDQADSGNEEYDMEIQEDNGEEDEQVNINISHGGLADGLRPMAKTKVAVNISAQPVQSGPVTVY